MYGDIVNFIECVVDAGWDGFYIVIEWGVIGYWEVDMIVWGVFIENNSSQKVDFYWEWYKIVIEFNQD